MCSLWKQKTCSHRREVFEYKEAFLDDQLCEDGVQYIERERRTCTRACIIMKWRQLDNLSTSKFSQQE
jgi:hypothetical protein